VVLANSKNSSAAFRSRSSLLFGSMIWPPWHTASILQFGAILNELNKQATQLPILDAHECLCQSQSVGTGTKLVHVGGSCRRGVSRSRGAFEKERDWHLQELRDVLQPAGTMRFFPFSYF
jgi:hypothetical protein